MSKQNAICRYCDIELDKWEMISHECNMRSTKVTTTLLDTVELVDHASTLGKIDREYHKQIMEHLAEAHELIIKGFRKQKDLTKNE